MLVVEVEVEEILDLLVVVVLEVAERVILPEHLILVAVVAVVLDQVRLALLEVQVLLLFVHL